VSSEFEWRDLRKGTRGQYRQVERRWVVEYVSRKCSKAIDKFIHKRLGTVPTEALRNVPGLPASAYRVFLPYADAVCVWPDRIEIMEFKVHDPTKGIAQLLLYKTLAMQDDELKKYLPRPIVLKLVYWRYDLSIDALCKANGIVLEVERPDWLVSILREYGYKVD